MSREAAGKAIGPEQWPARRLWLRSKKIFFAQCAKSLTPVQRHDPRPGHQRTLGHGIRVQEQPPVQLDPQSRCLVDEAEILSERHEHSQLHVANVRWRIKAFLR